jgi:hypothetical protein
MLDVIEQSALASLRAIGVRSVITADALIFAGILGWLNLPVEAIAL